MPQIPDMRRWFLCRLCQRESAHVAIANGILKRSATPRSYRTFQVVQCNICESTTYVIETHVHPGPMMGDPEIQSTEYFPPIPVRIKPEWFDCLPEEYQSILTEVYQALDHSLLFLTSTGTRTAVDQLIVDKIGDVGSFEDKISELVERKIIDSGQGEMLLALIDAGSASTHRSYKPDPKHLHHMMDILESIFYSLLIEPAKRKELEDKAAELRRTTPKRIRPNTS